MSYPYAEPKLQSEYKPYSYSTFIGRELVDEYRTARRAQRESLTAGAPPGAVDHCFDTLHTQWDRDTQRRPLELARFLDDLIGPVLPGVDDVPALSDPARNRRNSSGVTWARNTVDTLLAKYEAFGRIYPAYDGSWRRMNGDEPNDPPLLARLAAAAAWRMSVTEPADRAAAVATLNVLLKLHDRIAAQQTKGYQPDATSARYLRRSIDIEMRMVECVARWTSAVSEYDSLIESSIPASMEDTRARPLASSALIAYPGLRSRAYLQTMVRHQVAPSVVIQLGSECQTQCTTTSLGFDPQQTLAQTAAHAEIPLIEIDTRDVNDPQVTELVRERDWAIYSGGGVVSAQTLDSPVRWLHIHPGRLPDMRGSTCLHYGLLLEGAVWASAFVMEPTLDTGRIVARAPVPVPAGLAPADLDHAFDAHARAEVLIRALRVLGANSHWEGVRQTTAPHRNYFIIHPVLKHLAVLSTLQDEVIRVDRH